MRAVPRLTFVCIQCGEPFKRMASQIKREKDKPTYCCAACRHAYQRRGSLQRCIECGAEFYKRRVKGNKLFCSRGCFHADIKRDSHSYPKIGERHAHRVVMEETIGRTLTADEIVHHRDHDIKNFSAENLQLTNRPDHFRMHLPRKHSPEHIHKRVEAFRRTIASKKKANT